MRNKKLVVLIPAFNEQNTIADVIKQVPRRIEGIGSVKVLVFNDGSRDKTIEKARKGGADKIVSHAKNRGLGTTFRNGIWEALKLKADIIVNIDADGQFNARDIPRLISPILEGEADVTTCTRFKQKAFEPRMPWVKKFGNNLFTGLVNWLTKSNFTDTQCGFRAYSKEAALRMNLFGKFTYTQESLMDLLQKGIKIREVPCKVLGERNGKSRVVKHWYSYGLKALLIITRSARDYRPLQFFGAPGLILSGAGLLYGLFLWLVSLQPNVDIPFWRIVLAFTLVLVGMLMIVLALLADMNGRQRQLQEELLYRQKKAEIEGKK